MNEGLRLVVRSGPGILAMTILGVLRSRVWVWVMATGWLNLVRTERSRLANIGICM